jgi:phosphoketolase
VNAADHAGCLPIVLDAIRPRVGPDGLAAVAHRIVHGGPRFCSLSHAFGAAFDNPELLVAWVVGDGEAETFSGYEAFVHIVDSMFNQHAKWRKVANGIPWRRPIASLNYLLSSHVWRQDHNGFSHQDPGFIDHVVNSFP